MFVSSTILARRSLFPISGAVHLDLDTFIGRRILSPTRIYRLVFTDGTAEFCYRKHEVNLAPQEGMGILEFSDPANCYDMYVVFRGKHVNANDSKVEVAVFEKIVNVHAADPSRGPVLLDRNVQFVTGIGTQPDPSVADLVSDAARAQELYGDDLLEMYAAQQRDTQK